MTILVGVILGGHVWAIFQKGGGESGGAAIPPQNEIILGGVGSLRHAAFIYGNGRKKDPLHKLFDFNSKYNTGKEESEKAAKMFSDQVSQGRQNLVKVGGWVEGGGDRIFAPQPGTPSGRPHT